MKKEKFYIHTTKKNIQINIIFSLFFSLTFFIINSTKIFTESIISSSLLENYTNVVATFFIFLSIFRIIEKIQTGKTITIQKFKIIEKKEAERYVKYYFLIIMLILMLEGISMYLHFTLSNKSSGDIITLGFFIQENIEPLNASVYLNGSFIGNTKDGKLRIKGSKIEHEIIELFGEHHQIPFYYSLQITTDDMSSIDKSYYIPKNNLKEIVFHTFSADTKKPISGLLIQENNGWQVVNGKAHIPRDQLNFTLIKFMGLENGSYFLDILILEKSKEKVLNIWYVDKNYISKSQADEILQNISTLTSLIGQFNRESFGGV